MSKVILYQWGTHEFWWKKNSNVSTQEWKKFSHYWKLIHISFFFQLRDDKIIETFLNHYIVVDQRISTKSAKKAGEKFGQIFGSCFRTYNVGNNTRRLFLQNHLKLELRKSILYHTKGLEKIYPMTKFLKTLSETINIKSTKNPETNLKLVSFVDISQLQTCYKSVKISFLYHISAGWHDQYSLT